MCGKEGEMKRRLFLSGEIGCGKSTLIKQSLGAAAEKAGGFVTIRIMEDGILKGFELAPAAVLASERENYERRCFLSFSEALRKDDTVFAEYGPELLREAMSAPFAVLDEIGGVELLVTEFWEKLLMFLKSDVPCVGVIKTERAAEQLQNRVPLGDLYEERYGRLRTLLLEDENTKVCSMAGHYDTSAAEAVRSWININILQAENNGYEEKCFGHKGDSENAERTL